MKTVVLVDDNPMILQAFRHSIPLDSLGYQVIGYFTNSSEALAFCSTHRPQMLITDIKMPGMSGLELIERLQAVYSNFSSIVITGYDEFAFAQKALRLGAVDIILKPIDDESLISALRRASGLHDTEEKRNGASSQASVSGFQAIDPQQPISASVRRALDYLREHLAEKTNLADLADYVGLSSTHLSKLLKKDTGMNFIDINNRMRVEKAISLLADGRYKIYEISNLVGIDNYAYFYQIFKKITGKSPKEFQYF